MGTINMGQEDNFQDILSKAQTPVVADFWAPWCGPCRMLAPELEAALEELGEKVQLIKVNIDDFPELAANDYKVLGVPTLVIFKDGKEQDRLVGFRPRQAIKDFIEKQI